ncbi:hypothetical protein [Parapedobacter defluvii]|nr:hypothetical protein [Parapedobacter defluvii]
MLTKNQFFLSLLVVILPSVLCAQSVESRIPYYRYHISAEGGINRLYGDLTENTPAGPTFRIAAGMFLIHGFALGLEAEVGLLKADNAAPDLESLNFSKNNYTKAAVGIRLYPLLFLQDDHDRRVEYRQSFGRKVVNRFYLGAGFGLVYNTQLGVHETYAYTDPLLGDDIPIETAFSERDRGASNLALVNGGFDIPLSSLNPNKLDFFVWMLNLNFQTNLGLGKGKDIIDGWISGNGSDAFNVYSIGLKVAF